MVANPIPSRRSADDWSPNQLAKRQGIVRATAKLMAAEGVQACTSRAIAVAGEVSTSALHYYFRDTEEVLDLAFRYISSRFWDRLRLAAAGETRPVDAFWAAATAYLQFGSEWSEEGAKNAQAHAPMLWFEYQAASLRAGNLATAREISSEGLELFRALLSAVRPGNQSKTADVVYSVLLGASIRDSLFHRPAYEVLAEMASVLGLPASAKYCRAPISKPIRKSSSARSASAQERPKRSKS
jgi:AcrR family transcriptional regulator